MRSFPFIQTSVFTDDRFTFSGNQLATFLDLSEDDLSSDEMLGITREMNFSETTFVLPSTEKQCVKKIRIFTPGSEIPFAGHPTLGTAYVLKNKGIIGENQKYSHLELGIGPIRVEFFENDFVTMQQPEPSFLKEFTQKNMIENILGLSSRDVSEQWPIRFVSTGFPFLIIPLTSLSSIKSIKLNVNLLSETLKDFPSQALLVFTPETVHSDSHVHARMFAPSAGVFEDPATGSAAGPLGAYLAKYNVINKHSTGSKFIIEQGYEINRPSKLIAQCIYESSKNIAVNVKGQVRKTAEGKFFL